jgi:peroxiredoxin
VAPFLLTPEGSEPESTPFDLFAPGAFDELKSKPPAAAAPAAPSAALPTAPPAGSRAAGVGPAAPQPKDEVPAWALPPAPPQAAGTGKKPAGGKKRTWIVDAVIIGIVLCLILSVVAYFVISDLGKSMISGIQATKETSQLLTSMPPATLEPTWTASPTFTLIPTDTLTPTLSPTAEPTGSGTAGRTPISPGAIGITAGMYPPDFSLQEIASQQTVTLHDYLGQPILIFFWATRCPYCNDEISNLQAVYEQYQEDGLVLLAVDVGETFAEVDAFRSTHDLTFPILLDDGFEASTLYKADSIPHHVFVGLNGRIMFVQTGELSATELANKVEATMRTYPTPTP